MYCNNCGAEVPLDGNFCQQCGAKLVALDEINSQAHPLESDALSDTFSSEMSLSLKENDRLLGVWRKVSKKVLQFKSESELATAESSFPWLWGPVDFVITEDKVILLAAKPISKVAELGKKTALQEDEFRAVAGLAVASIGAVGVFGMFLLTDAYEKLFGENNKIDPKSLDLLYRSGNAMWANRQEIEQWNVKCRNGGGFFAEKFVYEAMTGVFTHATGNFAVRIAVEVRDMNFMYGSPTLKNVSSNVKLLSDMSLLDFFTMLEKDFPEPNWRAKALAGIDEHFRKK